MKKKFVMSYSFGKDSTLSLERMITAGYVPVALLVMVNKNEDRSYFHGVNYAMMEKVSQSLDIPLLLGESSGDDYKEIMIQKLNESKKLGAELAVFGDIDIEDHFKWCADRCAEAEIEYCFPLWQERREDIVKEILSKGFECIIKAIDNVLLPKEILGRVIDESLLEIFKEYGVDICGENGEYHTLVVNGPIFKNKIEYKVAQKVDFGRYSAIEVL